MEAAASVWKSALLRRRYVDRTRKLTFDS